MTKSPVIVRNNETLKDLYTTLKAGDIICGRIRLKPGEEYLIFDLTERGIACIPSARSQLASRSKTFQSRILQAYMLPGTLCVYDQHDLLKATTFFNRCDYRAVVLKREGKNGGLGIHKFGNIEELYNQVGSGGYPFPFVIQPYHEGGTDIRVIILAEYHEAYLRTNPYNFRQNMHCGGISSPHQLSDAMLQFCTSVMSTGQFPYAHLDIFQTANGEFYLQEINLRGGLRGALISPEEYNQRLEAIHERQLVDHLQHRK